MRTEHRHEYVIRCDGVPRWLVVLKPSHVGGFCRTLTRLFPQHEWAVADRFQPQGAD